MESLVVRARALRDAIDGAVASSDLPMNQTDVQVALAQLATLIDEMAERLETLEGSVTTTVVKTRVSF